MDSSSQPRSALSVRLQRNLCRTCLARKPLRMGLQCRNTNQAYTCFHQSVRGSDELLSHHLHRNNLPCKAQVAFEWLERRMHSRLCRPRSLPELLLRTQS